MEETTKIRVENLRAIESDEIAKRVPVPYARGFIKTYAEFLGADGEELAERFRGLHGNVAPDMTIQPVAAPVRDRGGPLRRPWFRLLAIGGAAVVAAITLYCLRAMTFWPHRVTVRAVGRVLIKVYRDGRFIWGSTIEPGKEQSWRAKRSIRLKITRPDNARVTYNGRGVALPGGGEVTVTFDRRGISKKTFIRPEKSAKANS